MTDVELEIGNLKKQEEYLRNSLKGNLGAGRKAFLELHQQIVSKLALMQDANEQMAFEAPVPPVEKPEPKPEPTPHIRTAPQTDGIDQQRLLWDFLYFAPFFKIKYRPGLNPEFPSGGYGPIKLTDSQIKLVAIFIDHLAKKKPLRMIILKSRQLGCTTILNLFSFWLCVTRPHFVSFFIIDKDDHMRTKRDILLDWFKQLKELFPRLAQIKTKSNKNLTLNNGSILLLESAMSPNPGTSENVAWCHTSEETKWPDQRTLQVKASIIPGIAEAAYTFIIRESTAEGLGVFHQDWLIAEKGGTYLPIFIPWYVSNECSLSAPIGFSAKSDPSDYGDWDSETERELSELEYQHKYKLTDDQLHWRRTKIGSFSNNRLAFDQEYPTTPDHAFRMYQSGFFGKTLLEKVERGIVDPLFIGGIQDAGKHSLQGTPCHFSLLEPMCVVDPRGALTVYEYPKEGFDYYMGVDTAEGIVTETSDGDQDPDYSVISVIGNDGRLCAHLYTRSKPEELWLPLALLGRWYNHACINGEINNVGPLLYLMMQTNYPNMLVHPQPASRPMRDRTWTRLGPANRSLMLKQLRSVWAFNPSLVRSRTIYGEIVTFVIDKVGKAKAASGFHDDGIMSLGNADICRRICLGLVYASEEAPAPVIVEQPIRRPEDGLTILDMDDPWLVELFQ